MKAERRHELKENELIAALTSARDYLTEHSKPITWGVIVVAVVIVLGTYVIRSRTQAADRLWQQARALSFENADIGKESLDKLMGLTRESSDEAFVMQTLIDQVGIALELSSQVESPPDRELNERARAACNALRERFPTNVLAQGVALCGLATVEENCFVLDRDGSRKDRARAHLVAILENPALKGTSFQMQAADRLNTLDETFTLVELAPPLPPAPGGAGPSEPVDDTQITVMPAGDAPRPNLGRTAAESTWPPKQGDNAPSKDEKEEKPGNAEEPEASPASEPESAPTD